MKKVIVLGSCGAGKSVFAKKLAICTNLPLHHLDKLYWKPYWEESNIDDFTKRLLVLINNEEWIIDGNYSRTITLRAARADTIIFLDYPRWLCIFRTLKRFTMGRFKFETRDCIQENCKERLNWTSIQWVWSYPYNGRPRALESIKEAGFPIDKVMFLRTPKQAEEFLQNLCS